MWGLIYVNWIGDLMVGFALEGGGAKGAYQAGAYIALTRNGIKPSIIAGTSIGSVNAALMAQGDINKLKSLWLNTTTDVFGINSKLIEKIKQNKFTKDDLKLGYDNIKKLFKNKGIDTSEFLKILEENIDENKLRKSKVKFGLVTIKVKGMEVKELTIDDIPYGKVAEYILASCYLPLFNYKPIIDNNYYIDGGFYNNIPLSLVENYGCDTIYSIRIKGIGFSHNKLKKETKVIEIKPKVNLGSIIIFDKTSNERNMKLGFYDALKVIRNLDGDNYYFNYKSTKYYDRIVRKVDEKALKKLKIKFLCDNNKDLVIKVVELLLNKNNVDNLRLLNIKKQIRYIRKYIEIKDKTIYNFIYSCKLF